MTYTPIPKGTPNWDVPLNAALAQLDADITASSGTALHAANNLSDLTNPVQARSNLGLTAGAAAGVNQFNVKDYGAVGNGVVDDRVAITNALAAASSAGGAVVFFPHGTYLVDSGTGFSTSSSGIVLQGEGSNASQISIGANFTGTTLFSFTGPYGGVRELSIVGSNTTTTSNPAAHAITATGAHTFRVLNATFLNINGYAIRLIGTASDTLHGGMIHNSKIQSCAGGVYIKSDSTATAANVMISNLFTRFLGVNSGTNANLDGIHIEDSWDVLMQNTLAWMNATVGGTGAALRVIGDCAAIFIQNLDALGPQTGAANVVIEGNANGDPQNVQIQGGVIQQGIVGLLIDDAANQVRVRNMRILNNQTHGVSVLSTGFAIYIDECLFSLNGQGAAGSNYDINWSGTATGFVTDNRFASPITSIGVAGVQATVNIAASQSVRFYNCDFAGTGAASTNWFTNFPQVVTRADGSNMEHIGSLDMRLPSGTRLSLRPTAAGNNALATNVNGADSNDRFRLLGNGNLEFGTGSAARDTTWSRQGVAQIGTPDSDVVIALAGKGLKVKEGSNAKMGTTTLNGTTAVTVNTTAVTATSRIFLTIQASGGTVGSPYVDTRTASTSFNIKSTAVGDTSTVAWHIIEPA